MTSAGLKIIHIPRTEELTPWLERRSEKAYPPVSMTRTHIERHLSGEQKLYYLPSRLCPVMMPMIDVDAHHGESDALDAARFILSQYFAGSYHEPSPRGHHIYPLIACAELSAAGRNALLKSVQYSLRKACEVEGFDTVVEVKGTYTLRDADGFLRRGMLAAMPTMPKGLRSLKELRESSVFGVDDAHRCIMDGQQRANFLAALEEQSETDIPCIGTQSVASLLPPRSSCLKMNQAPTDAEHSDDAFTRMMWACYRFATLPTEAELLAFYQRQYKTHPADKNRRRRAADAIKHRGRTYDASKAGSARYESQRDDLIAAVRAKCGKADRRSRDGRPISDEDLAIGLHTITAASFHEHQDRNTQWTVGHNAIIGMFEKLRAEGVTDAKCSNRHKTKAILDILQRGRLIVLLDSQYVPAGGRGISRKWTIGESHPRHAEFLNWQDARSIRYIRVADRSALGVREESRGDGGRSPVSDPFERAAAGHAFAFPGPASSLTAPRSPRPAPRCPTSRRSRPGRPTTLPQHPPPQRGPRQRPLRSPLMNIQMKPTDSIRPYEQNPRINDVAVTAVAASLKEFGWRQPIVVDAENIIVVGHTRYKAAQKLGLTEVPVHVATELTPAQARAYRIADNQTATIAEWDPDLLPQELAGLKEMEFDLSLLGFDPAELDRIMTGEGADGNCDPDDVPPVPETPITQLGDLWILGEHRLLCGDSTDGANVKRLLDGTVPFLMVTDPPYGVDYDPEWRHREGLNDSKRIGKVANDDRVEWTEAYKLFPGHVAYVWHAGRYAAEVAENLATAGLHVRAQIIWRKPRFAISRGHYHWSHEPCWYSVRDGGSAKWCGDRTQSTVWDIDGKDQDVETVHGTQKPCEAMARPIRNHGSKGDDVYDPFLGSGTTIIAAERLGRRCFAMELDPAYADVAVQRWEHFTGKKAERTPLA